MRKSFKIEILCVILVLLSASIALPSSSKSNHNLISNRKPKIIKARQIHLKEKYIVLYDKNLKKEANIKLSDKAIVIFKSEIGSKVKKIPVNKLNKKTLKGGITIVISNNEAKKIIVLEMPK